jgi:hypothetical protein
MECQHDAGFVVTCCPKKKRLDVSPNKKEAALRRTKEAPAATKPTEHKKQKTLDNSREA